MIDWISHYAGDIGTVVGAAWTCLSTFWAIRKHLECRKLRARCQRQADYAAMAAARQRVDYAASLAARAPAPKANPGRKP